MARNKLTGGHPAPFPAGNEERNTRLYNQVLKSVKEQMEGVMAQKQVISNDIRHIKANVQFQGKDWEKSEYIALLNQLLDDQTNIIDVLGSTLETLLEQKLSNKTLRALNENAIDLAATIKPRFIDYTKLKSSEYVSKYKEDIPCQ